MAGVDPYDTYDWDHVPDLRAAVDTARATLAASRTSVDTRPVEQVADAPVAAVEAITGSEAQRCTTCQALRAELAAIRVQHQHDYIPTVPRGF